MCVCGGGGGGGGGFNQSPLEIELGIARLKGTMLTVPRSNFE